MTAPADKKPKAESRFLRLHKAQGRVLRALADLPADDRKEVLHSVLAMPDAGAARAPQCEFTHADSQCVLYANHFGAHDLAVRSSS